MNKKKHKLPSKMLKFRGKRKALFTETEGAAQLWHKRLFCGVSVGFRHSSSPHLSILLFRKQNHLQRPRSVSDSGSVWERFDFWGSFKAVMGFSALFTIYFFKQKETRKMSEERRRKKESLFSLSLSERGEVRKNGPATALKRFLF